MEDPQDVLGCQNGSKFITTLEIDASRPLHLQCLAEDPHHTWPVHPRLDEIESVTIGIGTSVNDRKETTVTSAETRTGVDTTNVVTTMMIAMSVAEVVETGHAASREVEVQGVRR